MNLPTLQAELRQFAADRSGQPFQTPKNLAMAVMVEAAELAEIFQWMTPEQSRDAHRDATIRQHIGQEIADVLIYLVQLADHNQINLPQAVADKQVLNAHKYPPEGVAVAPGAAPLGLGKLGLVVVSGPPPL
jgi:NTP pyrophosphatase (non-canonical NTP hydrolase)